jgi:hypothetical protein
MYVYTIYTRLCQSRHSTADHALLLVAPATTDRIENIVSNNTSIVVGACLPRRRIETAVILLRACSFPREPVYRAVA